MTSSPAPRPDAPADAGADDLQEATAPACVMSFNVNDPSGASGIAADITTISSMGAHALPVVTGILIRDTAEVLDSHDIDPEVVAEQARVILEDTPIASWKVGFLGSAEGVSAVAEVIAEVNAYSTRYVQLDEAVAKLRLTGSFPSDRPEVLLHTLPKVLPVSLVEQGEHYALQAR